MKRAADLFCGAGGTTTGMLQAAERAGVAICVGTAAALFTNIMTGGRRG